MNICWFRRDLRLNDHAALYHALKSEAPVIPIFIFDKNILDKLENKADGRVAFIHAALHGLQAGLVQLSATLEVYYGYPKEVFKQLLKKYRIQHVFINNDYELYAVQRDGAISRLLTENGAALHGYKDQVIFEKKEIVKEDNTPYTVFTPYSRKWKATLADFHVQPYCTENYYTNFYRQAAQPIPDLQSMGFEPAHQLFSVKTLEEEVVKKYEAQRDYPGIDGTSRLGVHLRFGTISIRQVVDKARSLSTVFLNELIWREFYQMILWSFPRVGEGKAFKVEYDLIPWRNNEAEFKRWCEGTTGYPIVDAGMRALNETGFMHNRVRMIVASFLTKHLLIDWRWGEAYFAEKLLDFELASNNGGWQWVSGSGCDAVPYFRIFNPYLQAQKFDGAFEYIRKWVPEFEDLSYARPIVEHEFARKRCLEVYKKALQELR